MMNLVIIEIFSLEKNYKSSHPTVKSTTKLCPSIVTFTLINTLEDGNQTTLLGSLGIEAPSPET